jgi:hypothetical protein
MVIAVVLVMALVVVGGGTYLRSHQTPSYPSKWDPRIESIVQFVERTRGLNFTHPVAVEFMTVAKFKAKMGGGKPPTAKEKIDLERSVGELRALGLIHGDADLAAMDKQLGQESVIGLYVPHDKRVYVRGAELTPDVRVTLAHELTHALQDQHVDLSGLSDRKNADQNAIRALVEGDATRTEDAYAETLSTKDKAAYQAARNAQSGGADLSGVSQVLIDQESFPYIFGPVFVKALVASGGTAALDRALANPPTVDAQILDPNRYLIQQDVPKVAAPKVASGDTRLETPSPFGEAGMLQVLGAVVGYQVAWSALSNWRADESVPYLHGGNACVAIASTFDSAPHANAFAAVAQRWSAGRRGASVVSVGAATVELRACDPGANAVAGPAISPPAFEVLSLRADLMTEMLVTAKAPADVAACVADGVITTVGASHLIEINSGPAHDPRVATVRNAATKAALSCGYTGPQSPTSG